MEVWCDGMEITQFTYFQQMTSIDCKPVPVELTYGLERLCMFVQGKKNVFDIEWNSEGSNTGMFFINQKKNFQHIILNMQIQKFYYQILSSRKRMQISFR